MTVGVGTGNVVPGREFELPVILVVAEELLLLLLELLVVGADVVRMEAADNVFSSPLAVLVVMLSQFHSPYTSPTVL